MKKIFLRISILLMFIMFFPPKALFAEKVKPLNPDCDVCPVVISYEGDETKKILGPEGIESLLKLKDIDQKTAKIDLDGVRKPGSESDSDDGYELLVISHSQIIAINPIRGSSCIKIMTDFQNLNKGNASGAWTPEIQLQSSNHLPIEKTDDLETAWEQVKASEIYGLVNGTGQDHDAWNENLSRTIGSVLRSVAGK